jgi:hypothetical protein
MEQLFKKIGILLLGLAIGAGAGLLGISMAGRSTGLGLGLLPLPGVFGIAVVLAAYLILRIDFAKALVTYGTVFGVFYLAAFALILPALIFKVSYYAFGDVAGGILVTVLLPLVLNMRGRNWMFVGVVLLAVASLGVELKSAEVEAVLEVQRKGIELAWPGINKEKVYWETIHFVIWQSLMLGFMMVQLYEERLRRKAAGHVFA